MITPDTATVRGQTVQRLRRLYALRDRVDAAIAAEAQALARTSRAAAAVDDALDDLGDDDLIPAHLTIPGGR